MQLVKLIAINGCIEAGKLPKILITLVYGSIIWNHLLYRIGVIIIIHVSVNDFKSLPTCVYLFCSHSEPLIYIFTKVNIKD